MSEMKDYEKLFLANDSSLSEKYQALEKLCALKDEKTVSVLLKGFKDDSAIFKHEIAYLLGQMGFKSAIEGLWNVVKDEKQAIIARHEAAEALVALKDKDGIKRLSQFISHQDEILRDTCLLGIDCLKWNTPENLEKLKNHYGNTMNEIPPAPPYLENNFQQHQLILLDESAQLFDRYRAMYSLKYNNPEEAVTVFCQGNCSLLKHEVISILGHLEDERCVETLKLTLLDEKEHEIVRHEAAEAISFVEISEIKDILKKLTNHSSDIIKETCILALT